MLKLLGVVILVTMLGACAPVKFSKQDTGETEVVTEEINKEVTPLDHYLNGSWSLNYMISWMVSDIQDFRGKIYDIKYEIKTLALDDAATNKILVLEYRLNEAIRKFNSKGLFSRVWEVGDAIATRNELGEDISVSESLDSLELDGLSALSISDSTWGIFNKVIQSGFSLEEIRFID